MEPRGDDRGRGEALLRGLGETYKVELVDTAEGDFVLHAGRVHRPVPGPAPAGLEADQGAQADRARRRVLARRRAEHPAAPGSTAPRSSARRTSTPTSHRLEEAKRRDHRRLGNGARPLPPRPSTRPACRSGTRRAWCIWNQLEDLRRRENREPRLRRGQDAAPLRRRTPGSPRATGRSSATTCSSSPTARTGRSASSR